MSYRLYKITHNTDGTEKPSVDTYENVIDAEGNFEFQKGLAMESKSFAFLMLLDNIGEIHNNYITMIGEGTIKPRLFEVKVTESGETPKSYIHDTVDEVSADFYKRLGGAKLNDSIKAEMLRGVNENGNSIEYSYWVRPVIISE